MVMLFDMNALLYALWTFVCDVPWYYIALIPFWGSERIRKSRVLLISLAVLLLRVTMSYVFIAFVPNGRVWDDNFYFVFTAVIVAAFFACFKIHFIKLLYTVLLLQIMATMINYLSITVARLFNFEVDSTEYYGIVIIALIMFLTPIIPFVRRIFKHDIRGAFAVLSNKTIAMLCIMPGMFHILLHVCRSVFTVTQGAAPTIKSLVLLTILLTSLVCCYINIKMVLDAAKLSQSERTLAAEKLLLENLNRTKSEFYGNISHEMKTPLTIIATDIQLAEQYIDEGNFQNAKELIREAWQETMQAANFVTDALAFSRGLETSKPMERIDYGEVVKTTLAVSLPLIRKQGNILEQNIIKLPQIMGNTAMLAGALVNLLSNANRYTENGVISVRWALENERYCLTVRDNGSGIPPEILPRVFERGVTDGTGTGLGLAIVKSVMELHDGEAAIESELGKGTTVTLIFPQLTEANI